MDLTEGYIKRNKELAGIIKEFGELSFAEPMQDSKEDTVRYNFHKEKVKTMNDGVIQEIEIDDIEIPKEYVHDNLNSKIWDENNTLNDEVRSKLMEIAEEFYEYLEVKAHPKDIKLVGSMANYNWSKNSDIDIHLFFNVNELGEKPEFAKEYLDAKEKLWKQQHKIKVNGFDVELYAQDIKDKFYSGGIYSLSKNEWESKPSKEKVEVDKEALKKKIKTIADSIESLEKEKIDKNPDEIYDLTKKLKDKIKKMRQCGLERGGEFSIENLAFKYLRNYGYIGRLFDMKNKAFDLSLSLNT